MNTQPLSPRQQYNRLILKEALAIILWLACIAISLFITPQVYFVVLSTGFPLIILYSILNSRKSDKIECPKCGCKVGKGKFVRWRYWAKKRCIDCNYDLEKYPPQ